MTDRVLGTPERSTRLGTGIGTLGTLVLGPKAAKFGGAKGALPKLPGESLVESRAFRIVAQEGQPVVQLPELSISVRTARSVAAENTLPDLPPFEEGGPASAATLGGPIVESGINSPYPNAALDVWNYSQASGLPLKPHIFDYGPNFGGTIGARASTHAELKTLLITGADFAAVNKAPCPGCRGSIRWIAATRGQAITVLAPKGFYYFLPDGTIVTP